MAAVVYYLIAPSSPSTACLLVGLCIGAFLRDIGHFQGAYRMWPVTQQITDWNRVTELIESHEKDVR